VDFFVYFHHSRWVEAFGCTIAEALASGAVAILPRHFQELFGESAVYCETGEVAERVRALRNDRDAFLEQSRRGRELVAARFGHGAHLRRLEALIGPPRQRRTAVSARAPRRQDPAGSGSDLPKRVLFLSSNGVGMGHLTRLLAIARRCPATLMPVFATMSQAVEPIEEAGYLVEYLPFHGYLGCDIYRWNKYLHQELNELIAFYEPPVVVCDFNSPFQGVVDAIKDNPQTWFVWCRRGMWRANAGAKFIEREHHFHAVLEPDDLASAFDFGLTAQSRDRTRVVPPIRLLDDQEMLPREAARRELGLDLERPAAIVQLGSGNNYDYRTALHLALDHLARSDVQVVVAEWLMSQGANNLPPSTPRVRKFPLARWYRAFDMAVSAVGYNAFHELIFARIPTVFMPNENPQQDDQLGRARYAERHGLGFCVRTRDIYRLKPALDRLLDPDEQSAIRARCAALDPSNGAAEAARMIEEYAFIRRVERVRGP
jgi:Glycosyltransferase family 28 C-terminal domain